MNKNRWIFSLPLIAALSLLGVLVMSSPVHAQDEQPLQPGETPVEVVFNSIPAEQQDEAPTLIGETAEPLLPEQPDDQFSPIADIPPGETPVEEETPLVFPTETDFSELTSYETTPMELTPALEAAAEAGVTLVDGSGEPLALTTEEAADVLATGDPWYKVGAITYRFFPTIGGDCSGYPVGTCWISDTPIQAAIDQIPSTGLPSDGMIYIEAGNYAETLSINNLTSPVYKGLKGLIGAVVGEIPLVNLTGTISINAVDLGFTIKGFNITANAGNPGAGISITDSKGAVKIEDVSVTNSNEGPGIKITNHNGVLTLNRVKADKNLGGGVWLENLAGTAGVTITNSSFDENDINAGMSLQGAFISTKGTVLIDGASISRTTGSQPALKIDNCGAITIKNSIFNDNGFFAVANNLPSSLTAAITLQNVYAVGNIAGLHLQAKGNISLTGVHADENTYQGAVINTCNESAGACSSLGSGSVTIIDSTFDGNGSSLYSLWVQSRGAIALTNVSASGATNIAANPDGAVLDNHYSQLVSPVTITNGMFNTNDGTGLAIYSKGAITLTKVHAGDTVYSPYLERGNGGGGAYLDNTSGTAGVTISGSASGDNSFSHNGEYGLDIRSKGAITVKYADAHDNGLFGLHVNNQAGAGAVSISKGIFYQNTYDAIGIFSKGNVSVSDVEGTSNLTNGLYVSLDASSSSSVTVTNSEFSYCGSSGLYVNGRGNITLTKVKTNLNDLWGSVLQANTGNITIKDGGFVGNHQGGLVASTKGVISLTNVTATDNVGEGVNLDNTGAGTPKAVTITNGNFNFNNLSGLKVLSKGAITLKNVNATNNNYKAPVNMGTTDTLTFEVVEPYGEDTFTFTGPTDGSVTVLVNSAGFYGEMWLEGCGAVSTHYIETDPAYELSHTYTGLSTGQCTLHVKDTNDETGGAYMVSLYVSMPSDILPIAYGAFLDNHLGTAGITITNPSLPAGEPYTSGIGFSMNAAGGLELRTNGAITLTNIWTGRNAQNSVDIQNHDSAPPYTYATNVTITNFHAWENYGDGIYVKNKGAITLTNVAGEGNWEKGAYLNNQAGTGNVTIKNNPSSGTSLLAGFDDSKYAEGVYILTHGAVTLTNVNLIGNGQEGLELISDGLGTVTLTNCRVEHLLSSGSARGISIQTNGAVVVNGGYSYKNTSTGLFIRNDMTASGKPVTISNFTVSGNKTSGIDVASTGAITLFSVGSYLTVSGSGVVLDNSASTAGITLSFIEASYNEGAGIDLKTQGAVSFKTGNIWYNNANGVQVNFAGTFPSKALVMSDLYIYHNVGHGFVAQYVNGAITATNIECLFNQTQGGIVLSNAACANCPVSFLATGTKVNDIRGNFTTGLQITTNGAVTLNKVQAGYNQHGYGVVIENNPGLSTAPKVTINSSEFKFNGASGIYVVTTGIITLNTIEASDNGFLNYLCNLPDTSGEKGVNVFKSKFNHNGGHGLQISTHGAVVINKLEATGNLDGGMGVWINNNGIPALAKPVSILSTYGANVISSNGGVNLLIESSGAVVLNGITADSSVGNTGIWVDNSTGTGTVTLTTITTRYNNNNGVAIITKGNVTISGLNSLFNSVGWAPPREYNGLLINTNNVSTAKVTISNSLVSGNADHGIHLYLAPGGLYSLTNTYYFGNDTDGDGGFNLWVD